jgi:hypothetical protein
MPVGKYEWMEQYEIDSLDIEQFDFDGEEGFIAEVDLEVNNALQS